LSVLIFLIPITLLLGLIGLVAFLWCIKTNQYQDLKGASSRMLLNDKHDTPTKK